MKKKKEYKYVEKEELKKKDSKLYIIGKDYTTYNNKKYSCNTMIIN